MRLNIVMVFLMLPLLHGHAAGEASSAGPAVETADRLHRLLQTAFDAVSKMPADPHIRNRSAAQEKVVGAALELNLPERAIRYADQIGNWRRGTAYADIALYYAKEGEPEAARQILAKAEQLARNCELVQSGEIIATGTFTSLAESMGEWRMDRVKAHIARTHVYLYEDAEATRWSEHISDEETPRITAAKAGVCTDDNFKTVMESLCSLADTEQFEAVKNALSGLCGLYDRFYTDAEKRHALEQAIERYRADMPGFVQVEIGVQLAEAAIRHADPANGLLLAQQADSKLEGASYRPRLYFPMKASLVALLYRGGDRDTAAKELDAMVGKYDARRDEIIDIYRAAILCRIAEAHAVAGRAETARQLYRRAAAEAVVNPNSRPRAEDLSEICRSMAVYRVDPTPEQFLALEKINNELGNPW